MANLQEADAPFIKHVLHALTVGTSHLNHHARVLGKENLHEIGLSHRAEVDVQATLHIGEGHLKQGGDQTTCADVVTGKQQPFVHQLLNGIEGVAEIFWILHRRNVAAHLAQTLGKSRTTQTELVE